ncbi:hypothetical protein C1I98_38790, partial [Spongiactinospora gelatinilytica]
PDPPPPTLLEFRRWQDHMLNNELIRRARRREENAARSPGGAPPAVARWRISIHEPNGYFEARREQDPGHVSGTGPRYAGWAAVPQAVPHLLSRWSVPVRCPIEVNWECPSHSPHWLLPYGGWLPGHRGNDEDHERTPSVSLRQAWADDEAAHRARFAAAIAHVRARWPAGMSVTDYLEQAAARLNATLPPARELSVQATHRTEDGLLGLGYTVTAGWIDPEAVAAPGALRWNDIGYRLAVVPAMAEAMRAGSVDDALDVWNMSGDPIRVTRFPGPAGPLYARGSNGTHRLHAARLLGMPAIWVAIRQEALPLRLTAGDLGVHGRSGPEQLVACWRGLLAKGLAAGTIEDHPTFPGLSALHLDDIVAPWLLADPERAVAWAAAYDHVYPGSLAECGIPPSAWGAADSWFSWLHTSRPMGLSAPRPGR